MPPATVAALLDRGAARLAAAGVETARREALLLLAHASGLTALALRSEPRRLVDPAAFEAALERRAARREPLALITGRQGFWTLDLEVSADTLIPRADSETLVEAAVALRPERARVRRVLDLGTGTGCLLLAALAEFPDAFGVGTDLSPGAAALARRNARRNGLAARAAFIAADWGAPVGGRFDLVLSNPPYIATAEIASLMPEVARHEPRRALDGGPDGLEAYRRILAALPDLLVPDGLAVLELGAGQEAAVRGLANGAGFHHIIVRSDLAGVQRALALIGHG